MLGAMVKTPLPLNGPPLNEKTAWVAWACIPNAATARKAPMAGIEALMTYLLVFAFVGPRRTDLDGHDFPTSPHGSWVFALERR
jgi:hypothetical protein